jgi:hypothetical protein
MFFMNDKVTALYVTRTQPPGEATGFFVDMEAKVARLNINQGKREDIIQTFGQPKRYLGFDRAAGKMVTYQETSLPDVYSMEYPAGFSVYMVKGFIQELRFETRGPGSTPNYAYRGKLSVGSSLDTAFEVMGQPDKVIEGGKLDFEDGVLYKDIDGKKGSGYYSRYKQGVRVFLSGDHVIAVYLPRTEPIDPTAGGGQ